MFKQFLRNANPPSSNVIELGGGFAEPAAAFRAPVEKDAEMTARLELKSRLHDVLLDRLNLRPRGVGSTRMDQRTRRRARREYTVRVANVQT